MDRQDAADRGVEWIERRAARDAPPVGAEPFDISAASVAVMLDTDPPPRRWLVQDRLPLGVVALLAAAGGTGKSMAVLQLAVAACTGLPWLGMDVGETGSVLIISAEDDRDDCHRRLHAVIERLRDCGELPDSAAELIRERLHIVDRVGDDNRLTDTVDRVAVRTGYADRVIATAQELPQPVLIVMDPLARFDGGEPNSNADGTRLIECAETIRRETGATVLLPHHVSKAGMRDGDAGQESVRGASGLVDGARWVGLMATMRRDKAGRYGIRPEEAKWYVHFGVVKANGCAPWAGMWLQHQAAGVLAPAMLSDRQTDAIQERADSRYEHILAQTHALIRRHGPMSARHIRDQYSGQEGVMRAGQRAVWAALRRAVEEGELFERRREDNRGSDLHLPPGAE